jgi:putative ABC transport system substrate-binding protein
MKKNLNIILGSIAALILVVFFTVKKSPTDLPSSKLPVVCISQIVEHPSLDQERLGLMDALKSAGYNDGENIKIVYQNAQGNLATATQIAKMQAGQHPAVLVGISTPSAQALLAAAGSQKIPLVFTAVTNPLDAKLINTDAATPTIFGVSDKLPIDSQIAFMRDFLPHVKTIGVIYNAGEINSTHMVNELKTACAKDNINVSTAIVSKTSDVSAATQNLVGRVDAIYVPNDNTAVSAMSSIVQIATKAKLPVFAGDTGSVEKGALASRGYDRFQLGQKAGALVLRILKGEAIEKTVDEIHPLHDYVNEKTLNALGIEIPQNIKNNVIVIGTNK